MLMLSMHTIKFVEVLYTVGGSSVSVGGFVGLGGAIVIRSTYLKK